MKLLLAENVERRYGHGAGLTKALDGLSLTVETGEFVAIMGPSGSGKTTLLNCIATIDRPTSGRILVAGTDVGKLKGKALAAFRRDNLGFVFQDFNLLDTCTAFENIALALSIRHADPATIEGEVRDIASQLGIADVLDHYPYELSGGQRQRVAAARAVVTHPKLVLADEPTGALDSASARALLGRLAYLNESRGATILMVTHDALAASYATRVVFLKDGRKVLATRRGDHARKAFLDHIMRVQARLAGGGGDAR